MSNFQASESNPWNPFIPTARDIKRTNKLAQKNKWVAGILTLLFPPVGMIYLNRGVNCLKILGYIFMIGFIIGFTADPEEDLQEISDLVGLGGTIALVVEQVGTIERARDRQKNTDYQTSNN